MTRLLISACTIALLSTALGACSPSERTSSADARRAAMLGIAMYSEPASLFPLFSSSDADKQVTDQIYERLADPDSSLDVTHADRFKPRLADRWTWSRDSLALTFHLDPRARWHDGARVTARDVVFSFRLYGDSSAGGSAALTNIDSATFAQSTNDSLSATVWFRHRSPYQFFDATYGLRILPAHRLDTIPVATLRTSDAVKTPIGTGPFRFQRWEQGAYISLVADSTNYRGRPAFDRLVFTIDRDNDAAILRLLAGTTDFLDFVRPSQLRSLADRRDVRLLRWPSLTQGALLFNLHDPRTHARPHAILGDVRVRRAIALAIDRPTLVASVFETYGRVAAGPIPATLLDTTLIPAAPSDTVLADRLLDAAGWHRDASGMRQRAGRPLRFTVLTYGPGSRGMVPVILQDQLKRVGIAVDVQQSDVNAVNAALKSRRFDAAILNLDWGPTPADAREVWTISADSPEGLNRSGWHNAEFDALLDSASRTAPERARVYYRRAWALLVEAQPAVWLYEPINLGLASAHLRPTRLRADQWWDDLAHWTRVSETSSR